MDAQFFAIVTDLVGPVRADERVALLLDGAVAESVHFTADHLGQADADPETGLHYNHRYYDPTTATYLTPDPLGLAAGPDPHTYVPNPTSWTDPSA